VYFSLEILSILLMKNLLIAFLILFTSILTHALADKYGEALMNTPLVVDKTQQVTYNGQLRPALTYGVISSSEDYYKD
jgi:hypothetical protein